MPFAQSLLLTIYYAFLGIVVLVMLYRALLILRYYRCRREDEEPLRRFDAEPQVTVQLPLFNEQFVIERLVDQVCAMDWPRDRLQIQILDDSTDETVAIAARKAAEMRERGFDVVHIHRTDRTGYKAGALRAGLPQAKGEFVAIFDADFMPRADFLRRTVDYFTDEGVGFVQGRWDYLNRSYSYLTQGMGMLMDGHFVFEQTVRSRGGYIFNFNGTAGIWRKGAIAAAGGWQDETICEDTDLSYRTYLAGYRGVYLRSLPVPSELPVQITALKSQQHRWAKGLTECLFKTIPPLWKSDLPLRKKIEGLFHLGGNLAYPASLFMTAVALPVMILRMENAARGQVAAMVDSFVFLLVVTTQILFYVIATRELHPDWIRRLRWLPFFPLIGVGLAVNNARGVMEALTGLKTEFVRTPKLGVLGEDRRTVKRRERTYTGGRDFWQAVIEIGLGAFYVYMAVIQWSLVGIGAVVTLFLSLGLFLTGGATLRALWLKARASTAAGEPAAVSEGPVEVIEAARDRRATGAMKGL